jgi:hypothetical protein
MAILDLLRRTKKRVDDAIPDFNVRQKAGNVLRQANQIRQNLPIAREGRRLTDMLSAQRERQAEQARLRREREAQARERRMEESRRRMEQMKAREQERNQKRQENQRKLREKASAVGKFAADIPKGIISGGLTTGAIVADTGVKALQKGEDIVTAPLGKKYKERLQKTRKRQSETEDRILSRVQPLEEKKGEGFKNYLKGAYNQAVPTLRDVKTATPLQRGAALVDTALNIKTGGTFAGLKQAGKQGVKQIAKQYGKTAALGAASGAAGTATQKDATAKDIATGAVGGAVFGTALKGAGDVAPVVVRKAGSTLSKARKGIASALQEPKFKPGFASTKGKKGLEPAQPKVEIVKDPTKRQQIINSVLEGDLTLRAKRFNNRKLSPEELSVVQRSVDSGLEKLGIKSVKEIRDIEGFTPAPEVKEPKASSASSLIKEAQERLQTKATEDINPQIKRLQDLGATEKEASDLIKSVGFDKAQNALASIKDAPDVRNRGGLAYNIATGKTKPREISKPLTEFGDFTPEGKLKSDIKIPQPDVIKEKVFGKEPEIPSTLQQRTQFEINQAKRDAAIPKVQALPKGFREVLKDEILPNGYTTKLDIKTGKQITNAPSGNVKPEISIKRPQKETDTIIRKSVFAKQPTVKLQTETPTTPRNPRQLAEEAVQRATKEPISPEIPPVARVSTKEDISVGKAPEIKTRRQQIKETAIKADDDATQKFVIEERRKDYKALEAQYQKIKNDKFATFEDLYKEHESGVYTPGTEKIHKILKDFLDDDLEITKERFGTITPIRENYIHHTTKESALRNITEGVKQGVGDVLYTAGFAKRRTGALKDYTYGMEGALAHLAKAMGPVGAEQKAFLRTANAIKNQLNEYNQALVNKTTKSDRKVDVFSIIKNNFPSKSSETTKYAKLKSDWSEYIRSIFNTSFRQKDDTFTIRQDFIKPFTNAERDYSNKLFDLTKLSTKKLKNTAEGLGIRLSEKPNRVEIMSRLSMYYKKEYFGPATETFIRNVGKADATNNPNLITLINDIGELYINKELREVNVLEKTLGTIRQQFSLGMIGANVGNALQNTLETTKSLAFAGLKNTAAGVKDYFSGKGRELKRKYYGATSITQQFYEKEGLSGAYSKIVNTISPALYYLQQVSEDFKDTVLLGALERKAIKKGLTGDRLQDYVENNFQELAIKMGGAEDIKLFTPGQGGQIFKTTFQFMQYRIKDTVKFVDSLHNALSKQGFKNKMLNEDMGFAFWYTVNAIGTGLVLRQAWGIGQSAFGPGTGFVPFDLIKDIKEGKIVGPIGSVVSEAYNLAEAFQMEEGSKRDEKINEAQQKLNNLAIGFIVPAYGQIRKTYNYDQARKRGYFETTGKDKNVANLVTEDNWGAIRAYILGESYDPERQQYFKDVQREKSPNLGKQESAVFKEIKERSGIEKAKEFFAGIMNKREANKALEDLEEGKGIDKPAGMSDEEWIKTQATNEVLLSNNMVPNDVLVQYYGRNIEFGKSGAERTKNESKVFNLITTLNNDDKFKKLSDEQKDNIEMALMEKAGISKDTSEYYNKSKNSVTVKYQMAKEEIEDNLSKNPNFDVFNYLLEGRRKINTKQFASQGVLKMLEQDGFITSDEYKVLDKKNFLYLDGEFKDRSVAVKLKGSGKGGKGGKGGKAPKIKLAPVPKAKDTIELARLRRQKLPTIRLAPLKAKAPVLKLAKSTKSQPKKLTVRKIRVK